MFTELMPAKDPDEVLDYSWDPSLGDGDTVSAIVVSKISGDAVIDRSENTTTRATFWLSGGTAGSSTVIQVRATLTGGGVAEQQFEIPVKDSSRVLPVSASQLRSWLRDVSDPDEDLVELIEGATQFIEDWTGKRFITMDLVHVLDAWPMGPARNEMDAYSEGPVSILSTREVEIPVGPLVSITSIKTFAVDGTEATFAATNYFADTRSIPGRVGTVSGAVWPAPGRSIAGIEISYKAGMGEFSSQIPSSAKVAIKQLAAHMYENREAATEITLKTSPMGVKNYIKRNRIVPGI